MVNGQSSRLASVLVVLALLLSDSKGNCAGNGWPEPVAPVPWLVHGVVEQAESTQPLNLNNMSRSHLASGLSTPKLLVVAEGEAAGAR